MTRLLPGQQVKVIYLREDSKNEIVVTLEDATKWPYKADIKILTGGNVFPGVSYDGYLVFDTKAMMENYRPRSEVKLIIPSIGTEFTAADTAIHSFQFEFVFRMR